MDCFEGDWDGIVIRPVPESEGGGRFPNGHLRIDPGRDTVLDRVGATSCCSPMVDRGSNPISRS
jgi:hypothetical protein